MLTRWNLVLLAFVLALQPACPARADAHLEDSPAPFSLTPVSPAGVTPAPVVVVPVASTAIRPVAAAVIPAFVAPVSLAPVTAVAAPVVAPAVTVVLAPRVAAIAAPVAAPVVAASAVTPLASPVAASYAGYVYPSNSVLVSSSSDLLANTDGKIFGHPAFPGRSLYWNYNESRWCYQDNRSATGWFFIPREVFIPPPF